MFKKSLIFLASWTMFLSAGQEQINQEQTNQEQTNQNSLLTAKAIFDKGLKTLKSQPAEAEKLFSLYLKSYPDSLPGRFNLALSFYQQTGKKDLARAYLRQILFENPYHTPTRTFLKNLNDKKYFWLWIPEDLILSIMALSGMLLILALFKKVRTLIWPLFFIIQSLGGYYFFHRLRDYSSLTKDSLALSAPDPKAPILFEIKAGALTRTLFHDQEEGLSHVQISANRGWVKSSYLLPINPKKKRL